MKNIKLPFGFVLTVWWWTKADKRQKKPTKGFGIIIERV
jgi:hypothetical protein